MNWTLDQLRTFLAIHEFGTVSAAADEVHLTPGAVSQQMKALREAVGKDLFIKDGRQLMLTDDGHDLVNHARAILDAELRAESAMNAGRNLSSQLTVGVFGSVAVTAMKPTIDYLREIAPQISIKAIEVDVAVMASAVADGVIDIALSVNYPDAPQPPQRGVEIKTLYVENFDMIVPPDADINEDDKKSVIAYANATDWVIPPVETYYGKAIRFACARAAIEPRLVHTVTDTAVSLAMAEANVGITVATPLMLQLRPTSARVVPMPIAFKREIVAIAKRSSLQRESVQHMNAALKHVFAGL